MIIGFSKTSKKLMIGIIFVIILLSICVTVDWADNNTTVTNMNETEKVNLTNYTMVDGAKFVDLNNSSGIAKIHNNGKVIIEKPKVPLITATGKPSCGCGGSYTWRTRTYVNYCPHCHRYNVLYDAHKWQARYEKELTCRHCGADYCISCGKEKYSWSKVYLRKA